MIEYQTVRVHPTEEQDTIELYGTFGWNLIDAQEVYSESTKINNADIQVYDDSSFTGTFMKGYTGKDGRINVNSYTKVTNYVTLRFSRDSDIKNYDEINELANEYDSLSECSEPKKPIMRTIIFALGMAFIIASVIMAIANHTVAEIWEIIVCVVFPLIMTPFIVIGWIGYKRRYWTYLYAQQRLLEVLDSARKLSHCRGKK